MKLKYFGIIFYILLLILIGGKLFFEEQFDSAWANVSGIFSFSHDQTIVIAYSDSPISLDPLANDSGSRARLLHIFEPLVLRNADLELKPALASSFGALDDLTWEFKIRSNVTFHDGTPLTMDDVITSLKKGKDEPNSGVKDLASGIASIEKVDDHVLHIKTESTDPLLPQKLSSFLIFPEHAKKDEVIGTGPYQVTSMNDKNNLKLTRFEKYWGDLPEVKNVVLQTISSRDEKISALNDGSVDILANVPQDAAKNFNFGDYKLATIPSLEVNFLMFNFDRVFKPSGLRKAVRMALDTNELAGLTQGFAAPVSQFVAKGIFGYDPTIAIPKPDLVKAEATVKSTMGFFRVQTALDLPKGLESLGLNVKEKLRAIGIDVTLNFLSPKELESKIKNHQSDFFFFGWASDLGDASDFLSAVAHSPSGKYGQYNGANYRNVEIDQIVEFGQNTVNTDKRLEKLRAAMHKVTVDDVIGIPLFSPETLYGVSKSLRWSPRVDGYVLAQEVKF